MVLYDESRTNVLSVTERINGSTIGVSRLSPGTTYVFAVASANRAGRLGPFSKFREVTTTGNQVDMENAYFSVVVHMPMTATTTQAPITTPRTTRITRYVLRYFPVTILSKFWPFFENNSRPQQRIWLTTTRKYVKAFKFTTNWSVILRFRVLYHWKNAASTSY